MQQLQQRGAVHVVSVIQRLCDVFRDVRGGGFVSRQLLHCVQPHHGKLHNLLDRLLARQWHLQPKLCLGVRVERWQHCVSVRERPELLSQFQVRE
jgi:hypothetical protein